jgi:hypothetical protein
VRSTIKIRSKNSLYTYSHFIEHLMGAAGEQFKPQILESFVPVTQELHRLSSYNNPHQSGNQNEEETSKRQQQEKSFCAQTCRGLGQPPLQHNRICRWLCTCAQDKKQPAAKSHKQKNFNRERQVVYTENRGALLPVQSASGTLKMKRASGPAHSTKTATERRGKLLVT